LPDRIYGEVRKIGIRAVHLVTVDDNEVIIPHAKLWATSVSNASSGQQNVLVVANFYLRADHDAAAVSEALSGIAETSPYRKQETAVNVAVAELPWGTRYRLKAYVRESREQFVMITDLTVRGKEQLRSMGVVFAQAAYAEGQGG
jgi:small conductance mechanosensitive channel